MPKSAAVARCAARAIALAVSWLTAPYRSSTPASTPAAAIASRVYATLPPRYHRPLSGASVIVFARNPPLADSIVASVIPRASSAAPTESSGVSSSYPQMYDASLS